MTTEGSPPLLIFSSKVDIATDHVVLKLEELGASFYRINSEDFPLGVRSSLSLNPTGDSPQFSWLGTINKYIDVGGVRSVWFRRHRLAPMPDDLDKAYQEYCLREVDWFIKGTIYSLDNNAPAVRWMNHPARAQFAESKVYQLSKAGKLGFQIPKTLISNDPVAVRQFWQEREGGIIAKPVRMGYFDFGDRQTCVFTTPVAEEHLRDDEAIQLAPVIYQELIPKAYDIRVTIVGKKVFSAAIDSQSVPSAKTDWRQSETEDLPHYAHKLPASVEAMCLAYMDELGLSFGALDLILTPKNEYVFLEVNSAGQWVWLEDRLNLPISQTIAEWLWTPTNN
jgi:glutathione synthase/RimK-type ligase-like ATP-grasp enzyme